MQLDVRKVVGARERVVHQGARQQLSRAVLVTNVLEPGLADTLCDAAVELAVDDRRVDAPPYIVHPDEALESRRRRYRGRLRPRTRRLHWGWWSHCPRSRRSRCNLRRMFGLPGKRSAELQESDSRHRYRARRTGRTRSGCPRSPPPGHPRHGGAACSTRRSAARIRVVPEHCSDADPPVEAPRGGRRSVSP